MTGLFVPDVTPDHDTLGAALKYAAGGFFVGPVRAGTKDPASTLGKGWPDRTTRDSEAIAAMFAGTDHGLFIHAGRSGAVIFDVDNPDNLHPDLIRAVGELNPPAQSTRPDQPGRCHYLFAQPEGRMLGNSLGTLASGWGDIRGRNGLIVVAPTVHADGGLYRWVSSGPVPTVPDYIACQLPDAMESLDAATDDQVMAFLERHGGACSRPELLHVHVRSFLRKVGAGESRHDSMSGHLAGAMREAKAGLLDARTAADTLEAVFVDAVAGTPTGRQRGQRVGAVARNEWRGLLRWAVAQAENAEVVAVMNRVTEMVPVMTVVPSMAMPISSSTAAIKGSAETATTSMAVATPDGELHSGQVRLAYRLAASHAEMLMHVSGLGWHCWDGSRWAIDERGAAVRAVIAVLREALGDSLFDKDLLKDVARCESDSGIRGVLGIASALEEFAFTVADLDADPYLLNCVNGTLDLQTMTLGRHRPRDRITKVTRAAFDIDAVSDEWTVFLERVLPDAEVRGYLQRLMGLALLGKVIEHIFTIATGTGANGKGTAYNAILHALGDYGHVAESDLFMAAKSNPNAASPAQMGLLGKRLVVVSETERDRPLATALMKNLTGGDPITARPLYGRSVTFQPSHTSLMVTNYLPKVAGDDAAAWRRINVVPFDVVIPEHERDGHLGERLELAADGILAWMVTGCVDYQQRGMDAPGEVTAATSKYLKASDAVARFIDECCIVTPHGYTASGDLFTRYEKWAVDDGAELFSKRVFGDALDVRGFSPRKGTGGRRLRDGLILASEEDPD